MEQNFNCNNSKLLLESLESVIEIILGLIKDGCKHVDRLASYTNYYVAITLKSFHQFNKKCTNSKGAISSNEFHSIYNKNFILAQETHKVAKKYFTFENNYDSLEPDEQIIIIALISLSSFYETKSIDELVYFLKTYISKLNKNFDELDASFSFLTLKNENDRLDDEDEDSDYKFGLFKYLMNRDKKNTT